MGKQISVVCRDIARRPYGYIVIALALPFIFAGILVMKQSFSNVGGKPFLAHIFKQSLMLLALAGAIVCAGLRILGFRCHFLLDHVAGKLSYRRDRIFGSFHADADLSSVREVSVKKGAVLILSLRSFIQEIFIVVVRFDHKELPVYLSRKEEEARSFAKEVGEFLGIEPDFDELE